jgi:signal transduction histidine kinase
MQRWMQSQPRRVDATIASLIFAISFLLFPLTNGMKGIRSPDAIFVGLHLVLLIPLVFRRSHTQLVAFAIGIATLPIWLLGYPDGITAIAGTIGLYSQGRYVERPNIARAAFGLSPLVVLSLALAIAEGTRDGWSQFLGRTGVIIGSFAFGDAARNRAALIESFRERAHRAESDRTIATQQAATEERSRIAIEMHDVVAHSLSVMVVQAGAAERLIDRDAAGAKDSIRAVGNTGRDALAEMRRILGVLGGSEPTLDLKPQPSLDDLENLLARCRSTGLQIRFEQQGQSDHLSAGVQLSVYRIVQEGLTNIMKHAGRAVASVELSFAANVSIRISDDGAGPATHFPRDGSGRGLVGMRQRVDALNGTLRVGPKAGGGFEILATFPSQVTAQSVECVSVGLST